MRFLTLRKSDARSGGLFGSGLDIIISRDIHYTAVPILG